MMIAAFLYVWMMAFIRAGGMMALLPVFSGQNVPVQVRVALAAMLHGLPPVSLHANRRRARAMSARWSFASVHELAIGLLMGFGCGWSSTRSSSRAR